MTIEIDDSGTGDIVGDAFIVLWRREMNEIVKKNIPLELYQTPEFLKNSREHAKNCVIEAFSELNVSKTEEVFICTGNIFDDVRKYLQENGYSYQNAKIEGHLQDVVEQTYLDHLHEEYGVPKHRLSRESGKKRFFSLLNWVSEDFPRRKDFVKSGFEKWSTKWSEIAHKDWMAKMVKANEDQPYERHQRRHKYSQRPVKNNYKKNGNKSRPPKSKKYPQNRTHHKPRKEEKGAVDEAKESSPDPERKTFLF